MYSIDDWGTKIGASELSGDPYFDVCKLKDGVGPAVIISGGWGSPKDPSNIHQLWGDWARIVYERYPQNPVWRVFWNTKRGFKVNHPLPIGDWNEAKRHAQNAGHSLARLILNTAEQKYVLTGHSLGGSLVLNAAIMLGQTDWQHTYIQTMHLLGAAYRRTEKAMPSVKAVDGHIYNYYSRDDKILKRYYYFSNLGKAGSHNAIGLKGFKIKDPKIINVDVSDIVGSNHSAYKKLISFEKNQ